MEGNSPRDGTKSEIWDLYDENRRCLGLTHRRGDSMKPGCYHLAAEILTVDDNGRLLITRRHPDKRYGGLWECSGGAALAGEDSLTCAVRELREETGLSAPASALRLLGDTRSATCILDTYLYRPGTNPGPLTLQESEVTDARWVLAGELVSLIRKGEVVPTLADRLQLFAPLLHRATEGRFP